MICAGYSNGGNDACQGSIGDPLFTSQNDQFILYGIASFGVGCPSSELPGVYTRVDSYLGWINQQIRALSSIG